MDTRDDRFRAEASRLGDDFGGQLLVGGNYSPAILHRGVVHVSGQVPRVGDKVVVTGEVGSEVDLARAQHAAEICAMRGLALIAQAADSLDRIGQMLTVNVYVRSAPGFTQQSEVANGASDLIARVLGAAGTHARTSVGVLQLPKGASVEVGMAAALLQSAHP